MLVTIHSTVGSIVIETDTWKSDVKNQHSLIDMVSRIISFIITVSINNALNKALFKKVD